MSWLVSAIVTPIIQYLGNALVKGVELLFKFIALYQSRKRKLEGAQKQAELVDSIVDQIKKLRAEGKPVPPELEQRLVDESSKINIGKPYIG